MGALGPRVSVVRPQTERDLKLIVSFHPEGEWWGYHSVVEYLTKEGEWWGYHSVVEYLTAEGEWWGYHSVVEYLTAEGEWWLVSLGRPHLGQKGPKKRTQQRLWSTQQVLLSLQPGHSRGPLPSLEHSSFFLSLFFL